MTEMVERVAAAIYERCNHWDYDDNLPPYSSLPNGAKAQWQDAAHGAIKATNLATLEAALRTIREAIPGYLKGEMSEHDFALLVLGAADSKAVNLAMKNAP